MLENNNLKICRCLAKREFQFQKGRSRILIFTIGLVSAMYLLALLLGNSVTKGLLYHYQLQSGSLSHITFYGLTKSRAESIKKQDAVKESVDAEILGTIKEDILEGRNLQLAIADEAYAKNLEAFPTTGRLPQRENEIAVDTMTLNSLGIPHELGEEISLTWVSTMDGRIHKKTFTLCGFGYAETGVSETIFWVSEAFGKTMLPEEGQANIQLGVKLHQPDMLEEQADELLKNADISDISYTTSLAFVKERMQSAQEEAWQYYVTLIFSFLCGFFIVFNIIYISVDTDVRFYGRLKAFGMTPRQIRRVVLEQANMLCLPGVLIGGLLGVGTYYGCLPLFFDGIGGMRMKLVSLWPFLATILLTWVTVLAAYWLPARRAQKISPAEAVGFVSVSTGKRENRRKRVTICKMALCTLGCHKKRFLLSLIALTGAFLLLCSTWIRYISYEEEVYLEASSFSDYSVADASVGNRIQTYNPKSESILPDFLEQLKQIEGVDALGVLRTREEELKADEQTWEIVKNFYNLPGKDGRIPREEMAYYPTWVTAYDIFADTGNYKSLVIGVDGLYDSTLKRQIGKMGGQFDEEAFHSGKYVIANAVYAPGEITTTPIGEKVTLAGKEFEVLAHCEFTDYLVPGGSSKEAAFSLDYILPMAAFAELYPDTNIRSVIFDTDEKYQQKIEEFLTSYTEENKTHMYVEMRSDVQKHFRRGVISELGLDFMIASILTFIGLVSVVNLLITKTLGRRREFAVYESLGMSRRQLKKLLYLEGLLHIGLLLSILVPVVFFITWFGMPIYYAAGNHWAYVYRYSLTPLLLAIPCLLGLSVLVPGICLKKMEKKSITERLKIIE